MDGERFDRITRSLLAGASRRHLLGGLVGGVGATIAGAELLDAKKSRTGKGKDKDKDKDKGGKRTICHCPPGNPDNCHTITVGTKAAESHLRNHPCDYDGACRDDVVNPCEPQDECLAVTNTEGDVDEAANGAFTLTTEGAAAHGNLVFAVPDDTTFRELEGLASTFAFATGTCAAGTPRFVVFLENGRCPYAAFPPGGDCADGDGTTGNLVGNNEPFVWNDDLCGGSGLGTNTYDEVLALYADAEIDRIVLVVDESGGEQTVTVDPCISLDTR